MINDFMEIYNFTWSICFVFLPLCVAPNIAYQEHKALI